MQFNYFYVQVSSFSVNKNQILQDGSCILNKIANFKEYLSLIRMNEL
jgi:hypothetical protein